MATDDEQLEDIRRWWQKNRQGVTIGLVIGLAAVFGTRAWMSHQEQQRLSASAEYEQFQAEFRQGDNEAILSRGNYLIENYARTPYAAMAALALAKVEVDKGDLPAAKQRLQWAMDHAPTPEFAHVARVRLVRVVAAQGDTAQALKLIEGVDAGAFAPSYDELRGDLYLATGDRAKARDAYQKALAGMESGPGSEAVQAKLDDLGAQG
jgi:predicted negative regulator of RcsB-dependent stress response